MQVDKRKKKKLERLKAQENEDPCKKENHQSAQR